MSARAMNIKSVNSSQVFARRFRSPLTALFLGLFLGIFTVSAVSPAYAQNFDFKKLRRKVEKYTVIVNATVSISMGSEPFESKVRTLGVVVSDQGHIIIDADMVEIGGGAYGISATSEVKKIMIETLDGREFPGSWLGSDQFSGVGFCQMKEFGSSNLETVRFRERNNFRVGEWVALFYLLPDYVAPLLAADVGMVTAVLSEPEASPLLVGFSSAQSNSVIFDESGNPVGILGEIADPSSGDFAGPSFMGAFGGGMSGYSLLGIITAERLQPLIDTPPISGEKNRGWLGVSFQALSKDLAEYWGIESSGGVIINEVVKGSPAEQAGLQVGDIVTEINNDKLNIEREENTQVFSRSISELGAEAVTEFKILRNSSDNTFETFDIVVELGQAPITSSEAETYNDEKFEFKTRNLVFNDYLYYNLDHETFGGVWVSEVNSGGWASLGGLGVGDIVQLVNGIEIDSVSKLRSEMKNIIESKAEEIVFLIWRDNKTLFVNIKPDWKDES